MDKERTHPANADATALPFAKLAKLGVRAPSKQITSHFERRQAAALVFIEWLER